MRKKKSPMMHFLILVVLSSFTFYFGGCTEQLPPTSPGETSAPTASLGKIGVYPQYAEMLLNLLDSGYEGGLLEVPNGSSFEVEPGSLIPPRRARIRGLQNGLSAAAVRRFLPANVLVSMRVDLVSDGERGLPFNKGLIYTFGPSGSKFDPPAKAWFDWSDLEVPQVKVYYIKPDGSCKELEAEVMDDENQRLRLEINHFSRYAIGWGE